MGGRARWPTAIALPIAGRSRTTGNRRLDLSADGYYRGDTTTQLPPQHYRRDTTAAILPAPFGSGLGDDKEVRFRHREGTFHARDRVYCESHRFQAVRPPHQLNLCANYQHAKFVL